MPTPLPIIEPSTLSDEQVAAMQAEIRERAAERRAVILAHNYQRPEVQDVAHFVGDSLGLAREAARTDAEVIVFCGVHFMAETAAILSPNKRVLLPDLRAGCSLADTITAEDVRTWRAEFPDHVAVGYVNTTAAVKAELDYCCTSGNVLDVIDAIPADRGILFLPDFFLGQHVKPERPGPRIEVSLGECHGHAGINPRKLQAAPRAHLGRHLGARGLHSGQRHDPLLGLALELVLHRAGRGGQVDDEVHRTALDLDVLDEAQAHDVLVQVGILDGAQGFEHLLFGHAHGHTSSRRTKMGKND